MPPSSRQQSWLVSCALKTEHYPSLQAFIKCSLWMLCFFFPCSWPASFCQVSTLQGCINCCLTWSWRVSTRCQLWGQLFHPVLDLFYLAVSLSTSVISLRFFFFPSHHQWFHFLKKLLPSSTQCWLDYKEGSAFTALDRVQWRVAANGISSGELWSAFKGKRRDLRCRACQWALCLDPSFAWDGVCQIPAGMTPDLRRPGWEQSDVPHLLIMA